MQLSSKKYEHAGNKYLIVIISEVSDSLHNYFAKQKIEKRISEVNKITSIKSVSMMFQEIQNFYNDIESMSLPEFKILSMSLLENIYSRMFMQDSMLSNISDIKNI